MDSTLNTIKVNAQHAEMRSDAEDRALAPGSRGIEYAPEPPQ